MRKVLALVFSLIFVFSLAFLSTNKAKATIVTDANLTVEGASIRTAGNQGMRFTANIGSFSGGTIDKYGICLVPGDEAIDDNFVIGGTVNGKNVINAEVNELDGSGKFHVVLWNIPAEAYTMNVSARAYVRLTDDSIVYGAEKQVRNVWTVAAKANSAGISSSLIDDVVNYISDNYMVKTVTSTNQFVISYVNDINFVYTDEASLTAMLEELWAYFIFDFNEANGTALVAETVTSDAFWSAMYAGISSTSLLTMPSDCNAVRFFSGVNMVKWGWLLEFFTTHGTLHVNNQAEALLREDRTCQKTSNETRLPCHQLKHLTGAIWNLFHKSYIMINYMDNYDMSTYSKYSSVPFPTVTDINGSNVVQTGSNVILPNVSRAGYTFVNYQKLGGSTYDALDEFEVTSANAVFTPNYSLINYSITYELDGGVNNPSNLASYNIETSVEFTNPTKDDYIFGGWYSNSLFTGSQITSISKGSTGNVVLYAKWVEDSAVNLDINSYNAGDKAVLDTLTPDIIVVPGLAAGKYKIINTSNDEFESKEYTFGTSAFNTLSDAVGAVTASNTIIYAFAGDYSGSFTISQDNTKIYGSNYAKLGTDPSRYTESNVSGVITVSANGVTLQGIKLSGSGNSIVLNKDKTITDLTIKNMYSTASGKSTSGGRIAIIGSDGPTTNLTISGVKIECVAYAGRNAIAIYGTVTGLTIKDSYFTNGAANYDHNSEVIRMPKISGTFNIDNNRLIWSTKNYVAWIGINSNSCTSIKVTNNVLSGSASGNTTSLGIYYIPSSCVVNIVGNHFEYFDTGTTLMFNSSSSGATINIKYNYFGSGVKFKWASISGVTQNYSNNYYATTQTSATSDYGVITSLSDLIAAYKASDEYTTYGSICVYED